MLLSQFIFLLFVVTPTYYSEEGCDLYEDLEKFDKLLQQDLIVKTFLKNYPNSTSFVESIDESIPPKAYVVYVSEIEKTKIELVVYVREISEELNDCFWPVQYTLKYQDEEKITSITNYSWNHQEIIDFLSGYVILSPFEQLRQGSDPIDIQCRNGLELILKSSDGSPACVKSETKQILIERGWAKQVS